MADTVLGPFYEAGGSRAQAALVLSAGCAALSPVDRSYDAYSFNGELTILFSGWGPTFQGNGTVRRDAHSVDRAIIDACGAHPSDPEKFLDQVSTTLALSGSDMRTAIDDACARNGTRVENGADSPDAPGAFDLVPQAIVAILGEPLSPRVLVGAYCERDAVGTSPTPSG